jgi:membrane fusion protein, multidrug efflux system
MSQRAWIGVVGSVLLVAGCNRGGAAAKGNDAAAAAVPTVEVAKAVEEEIERRVELTGTLAPWEEGVVAFEVEGTLTGLSADLGDPVKKGQVLARIAPREYELRKAQAEAELAAAESDYARQAQLATKDMATRQQVDEGRRRLDVARTAADLARKKLADTSVKAPFDGRIARRFANAGEYVKIGAAAYQVVRAEPLKFKGDVPERYAADVRIGDPVTAASESFPGHPLSGKVSRIGPSVAVDSRSFPVEAEIANPDGAVKPGTFVRVSILIAGTTKGVLVPESAVVQFAGNPRVFIVAGGKVQERVVELGAKSGDRVMVLKGVSAGESVATTGASLLADGTAVAVR